MAVDLPNGCSRSEFHVKPANWKTIRVSTKKPWYIQYRFYDPEFRVDPKYRKGRMILQKAMNNFTDLRARQQATRRILDALTKLLDERGYNPITEQVVTPVETFYVVDPQTGFTKALKQAADMVSASPTVKRDLGTMRRQVDRAAGQLRFADTPVSLISRKHIKLILQQIEKNQGKPSHHRYNKNRSYMMMCFKELLEVGAVDFNPVNDVKKMTGLQKIRRVLTGEERAKVDAHLKAHHTSGASCTFSFTVALGSPN
jgi:uncharacterized protein (UPF0297 family)